MGRPRGSRTRLRHSTPAVKSLRAELLEYLAVEEEDIIAPPREQTRSLGAYISKSDWAALDDAARATGFHGPGDLTRALVVSFILNDELPTLQTLTKRERELRKKSDA